MKFRFKYNSDLFSLVHDWCEISLAIKVLSGVRIASSADLKVKRIVFQYSVTKSIFHFSHFTANKEKNFRSKYRQAQLNLKNCCIDDSDLFQLSAR